MSFSDARSDISLLGTLAEAADSPSCGFEWYQRTICYVQSQCMKQDNFLSVAITQLTEGFV